MDRYCKGKIHINGKDYKWLIGEEFARLVILSMTENEMMEEIKEEPSDHDKALDETHGVVDVVEVKLFEAVKKYPDYDNLDVYYVDSADGQIETLTKAIKQLQYHVFNK